MRCDSASPSYQCNEPCFNPHTYMRCDYENERHQITNDVSIHTPTWGVTNWRFTQTSTWRFQSTHLHEVWPFVVSLPRFVVCFNPHTYMRCDHFKHLERSEAFSFNPHTYMRCDLVSLRLQPFVPSFNPHTYMRCDLRTFFLWSFRNSFNPHTYMRCDTVV